MHKLSVFKFYISISIKSSIVISLSSISFKELFFDTFSSDKVLVLLLLNISSFFRSPTFLNELLTLPLTRIDPVEYLSIIGISLALKYLTSDVLTPIWSLVDVIKAFKVSYGLVFTSLKINNFNSLCSCFISNNIQILRSCRVKIRNINNIIAF